jgi:hypothetical protein
MLVFMYACMHVCRYAGMQVCKVGRKARNTNKTRVFPPTGSKNFPGGASNGSDSEQGNIFNKKK